MSKKNSDKKGIAAESASKKRIVILDDHPLVCEGLATLIRENDALTVEAVCYNVADALQVLQTQLPDLLLLDISLPDFSGLDVLRDLQLQYPTLNVLVVSMYDENIYAELALRLGAKGYIMKEAASESIVEAIHYVLDGRIYASQDVMTKMLSQLSATGHQQRGKSGLESLTTREVQVYTLIGEGCSTREIAEKLSISPKTVQTYRENIKNKLNLETSDELSHSAWTWSNSSREGRIEN